MNYSKITDDLFIGTTPAVEDYDLLRDLGVRLVINMRHGHAPAPDPGKPPLDLLWLPTFDTPFLPIPIRALQEGARAALATIRSGGKVYAHCAAGRHRGAAMGAAILIAQELGAPEAMRLIKARRPLADPGAFYIRSRILRFARRFQPVGK